MAPTAAHPVSSAIDYTTSSKANHTTPATTTKSDSNKGGCGLIKDRKSPTWVGMSENETSSLQVVQKCLKRLQLQGHNAQKYAARFGRQSLLCDIHVNVKTVASTLARYNTIWLHGDSIMTQEFYTLACMLNSTVDFQKWGSQWNSQFQSGLHSGIAQAERGYKYNSTEQFTYYHARGATRVLYSRFGPSWGMDDNLYKHDFPYSVQKLTSNDAILTNAAAVHYKSPKGSEFRKAAEFILKQSLLTDATMFFIEPTPEEWPSSNGFYSKEISKSEKNACKRLSDDRLLGRGSLPTGDWKSSNPDLDFFEWLYPNKPWVENAKRNQCVPDCMPSTWRVDFMRHILNEMPHKIQFIPVYWQMVSRKSHSGRSERGDCTHRSFDATVLIHYQWIRSILSSDMQLDK